MMIITNLKLSVIMAVYEGDTPLQLTAALNSIVNQTRVPDEFVVVVDGPISQALKDILKEFLDKDLIRLIWQVENVGRGQARNIAINASTGNLIAIMDADDISRRDRLKDQVNFFISNDIDMCGGYIEEFIIEPGDLGIYRKVPIEHEKIYRQLRYRSAFNHVTLMFKRSLYNSVEGYRRLNHAEDWDFYLRCAVKKSIFANLNLTLVDVRQNISRRGGFRNFIDEVKVLLGAYKRNQFNLIFLVLQFGLRFIKAIMPISLRRFFHKLARNIG